jgi:hypothetical protein
VCPPSAAKYHCKSEVSIARTDQAYCDGDHKFDDFRKLLKSVQNWQYSAEKAAVRGRLQRRDAETPRRSVLRASRGVKTIAIDPAEQGHVGRLAVRLGAG